MHPVLSGRAIERIDESPLRQLVVTDTIPLAPQKRIDKIHVQSVARLFADAIQSIHDGVERVAAVPLAGRQPVGSRISATTGASTAGRSARSFSR